MGVGSGGGVVSPSRTLTFLFTDVEGLTRLWAADADAMAAALETLRSPTENKAVTRSVITSF